MADRLDRYDVVIGDRQGAFDSEIAIGFPAALLKAAHFAKKYHTRENLILVYNLEALDYDSNGLTEEESDRLAETLSDAYDAADSEAREERARV